MTSQINNKKHKKQKNENKQSQNNLEKYGFTNTKVAQKINSKNKQKKNIVLDLDNCAKLDTFGFTSE